jgi:Mg2+/citrate symporter
MISLYFNASNTTYVQIPIRSNHTRILILSDIITNPLSAWISNDKCNIINLVLLITVVILILAILSLIIYRKRSGVHHIKDQPTQSNCIDKHKYDVADVDMENEMVRENHWIENLVVIIITFVFVSSRYTISILVMIVCTCIGLVQYQA